MNRIAIISLFFIFGILTYAQEAEMEKFMLDSKDLVSNQDSGKVEIISASRNSKFLDDLPVTVYVIQREEILENGYKSLVDVLKDVPGMKVSQPGSAIDGETFLMNGLYGNYYCKILVNDIPITPSVVSGMPIARQLPIRQAQRIEIISGPSSALYGSDAIAGVINIITNESDRPAWAQADISVGTNGNYSMNVMIGGKTGKNKNVLTYEFYGNYNEQADMNVKYDVENNYNPALYNSLNDTINYLSAPFYKGDSTNPEFGRLPQSSNLIGFGMKYRGLKINYDHMSRQVHSSIGQSPNRYAYYDRTNVWGENIDRIAMSYSNTWNKLSSSTQVSYLRYRMNNNSSFRIIYNAGDKGVIYKYAASDDIHFDEILTYSFNPNFDISGGFSAQYSGNLPKTNDLSAPFDMNSYQSFDEDIQVSDSVLGDFGYNPTTFYNLGVYLQMYYKYNDFTLLAGGRWDEHSLFGSQLSPKIGLQYKISETLSVRSNYGQGFRAPSLYYVYNSQANVVTDGSGNQSIYYENVPNTDINPEKFRAFEFGIRHNPLKKIDLEFIFMYHKLKENISSTVITLDPNLYPNATPGQDTLVSVFKNDLDSKAELYSLQINVRSKNIIPAVKLNSDLFVTLSKGNEILPNGLGKLDDYRNVPNWFVQFNIDFRPIKNWVIILNNTISDKWKKRFFPVQLDRMEELGLPTHVDGYYTLDLTNRFFINRNFHAFLILNNVTNTKYGGLDAYASLYDLKYNPQYRIAFRLGFSFTLE